MFYGDYVDLMDIIGVDFPERWKLTWQVWRLMGKQHPPMPRNGNEGSKIEDRTFCGDGG